MDAEDSGRKTGGGMGTALMTGLERVVTVTTDPNLPALLRMPGTAGHQQLIQAEAKLIELAIREYRLLVAEERRKATSCRQSP